MVMMMTVVDRQSHKHLDSMTVSVSRQFFRGKIYRKISGGNILSARPLA